MTEEHLLNASASSVGKAKKFQVQNQNTNLSTEAKINFGKLPQLIVQPTQFHCKIYTFQDTSRQSTLKEATLPLVGPVEGILELGAGGGGGEIDHVRVSDLVGCWGHALPGKFLNFNSVF